MAAEQQPELSIPSPFGRKPSEEESPPHMSREAKFSGANGDREVSIFPVQLTTSRIGNLTRLTFLLRYVMSIHTYIHTYCNVAEVERSVYRKDWEQAM